MKKILVVLNTADAQAVPFELAARIKKRGTMEVVLCAYRSKYSSFPSETYGFEIKQLGARGLIPFAAIGALHELIRAEKPDLIHIHLWPSGIWAIFLGLMYRIKLVKTEHNDVRFQGPLKRLVNCLLYPFLDRLITNSHSTLKSLGFVERCAIAGRTGTVYNGVDFAYGDRIHSNRAAMRERLNAGSDFVIGTVGRFVKQKNYERLISAFAAISRPGLRLLMIGDGELRGELETQVRNLGLSERITFTGAVSREGVYNYLHAIDAFVVPSLWEGFCNAAVEAAGVGLPVIASDIVTLREVLGDTAIYSDPMDVKALGEAIKHVAAMPSSELVDMGQAAAGFVRNRYDIERAAESYEQAFNELLKS